MLTLAVVHPTSSKGSAVGGSKAGNKQDYEGRPDHADDQQSEERRVHVSQNPRTPVYQLHGQSYGPVRHCPFSRNRVFGSYELIRSSAGPSANPSLSGIRHRLVRQVLLAATGIRAYWNSSWGLIRGPGLSVPRTLRRVRGTA